MNKTDPAPLASPPYPDPDLNQDLQSRLRSGSHQLWTVVTLIIAGLVLIPIGFVLSSMTADTREIWAHLASTVLPRYLLNSLWLVIGVGSGVLLIGVGSAWLVTMCQFRGRRLLELALLLPLAAPAYVLAYTYTDFFQFTGPIQTHLRDWFNWGAGDYWFPNIRSVGGAILMLILVLYPYVYLVARLAFLEQSTCTLEASRALGQGPWRSFVTVAIPLARPSIVAGLSLVLMETLNDYGTVHYFGVDTFTTGIFRTWYGLGERVAATQLAALLLILIFCLLGIERWSRRRARYYQTSNRYQAGSRYLLSGIRALTAWVICGVPIVLGFVLPAGILIGMVWTDPDAAFNPRFWAFGRNSLILAGLTAGLAVMLALIMAYGQRLNPNRILRLANRIASIGYAIPGSVIAVGVLVPLGRLDNWIDAWAEAHLGISTGLLLSGTITALVFAYLVRFLAVSSSTVDASLTKIKPNLDEAARSLGYGPTETLTRIHAPLLWPGLLTAALLVFVDVMKELPATLVIRPFNFDTLAVRAYQLASDERLAEAAGPALAIVVVGILPVILLSWRISQGREIT